MDSKTTKPASEYWLHSECPNPDPELRTSPALARLVLEEGTPIADTRGMFGGPQIFLLGQDAYLVFTGIDGTLDAFGPYPDAETIYRSTCRVLLESGGGQVLDWDGGYVGLHPARTPEWCDAAFWTRVVARPVMAALPRCRWEEMNPLVMVTRWWDHYWVWGDGFPPPALDDHHPSLEAAWSAYMGGLVLPEGYRVVSRHLSVEDIERRFTVLPLKKTEGGTGGTGRDGDDGPVEGVVTVNGVELRLPRCTATTPPQPNAGLGGRS